MFVPLKPVAGPLGHNSQALAEIKTRVDARKYGTARHHALLSRSLKAAAVSASRRAHCTTNYRTPHHATASCRPSPVNIRNKPKYFRGQTPVNSQIRAIKPCAF